MKIKSLIFRTILIAFSFGFVLPATGKPKAKKVYMLGFAASFTDSVAFITDIQLIDPAYIETRSHFLYDRSLYSLQLSNYLEEKRNLDSPTCAIFFSTTKKIVEKKQAKLQKKYANNENIRLTPLKSEDFSFYPEEWIEHDQIGDE